LADITGPAIAYRLQLSLDAALATQVDYRFTLDLQVDVPRQLLVGTPDTETATPQIIPTSDAIPLVLGLTGDYTLNTPVVDPPAGLPARAVSTLRLTVPTPAIILGRPVVPQEWFKPSSSMSGTGTVIPDPEPDIATAGDWGQNPGGGDYRWLASDLALTGQFLNSWPAHDGGPSWLSVFPYRPKLRAHVQYGPGGANHAYDNGVFYNPQFVEHMWLDMAEQIPQPYSWIICGTILSYPSATYGHYLLDTGKARAPGDGSLSTVRHDRTINDGLSSRSLMLFERTSGLICTRTRVEDGVYVRTPHHWVARPRVFAGVFNGASSIAAAIDNHADSLTVGTVDNSSARYFVSGRRQNRLSDNLACNMLIFEMRFFRRALSADEVRAQYRQLAATYKFNLY